MTAARSFLFVPGDRPDMLAKARDRGADALIVDLEDAVAPSAKQAARDSVAAWLMSAVRPPDVWVRINHPHGAEDDLQVAVVPQVTGVMIPKVTSQGDLLAVNAGIDRLERNGGLPPGAVATLPIVETAAGLLAVADLARTPRVRQLMIGEFDLSADLGIDPARSDALLPMRMSVVVASAAAGLDPPLGPVSANFRDPELLRRETLEIAALGFGSRPAIHPAQVPVINDVFTPSAAEIERAARLVDLYEAALAEGRGSITDAAGHMVDEAVVRVARRVLARALRPEGTSE